MYMTNAVDDGSKSTAKLYDETIFYQKNVLKVKNDLSMTTLKNKP